MGVLDLAVGVVAESGAGVLQRHGVDGVGGGEGVPGGDGVLHEALPVLTSVHGFLVLDLGLCAAHFLFGLGPHCEGGRGGDSGSYWLVVRNSGSDQ